MVEIYVMLVMKGLRTFESVPDNLKPQVKARLLEEGYIFP